MFYRINPVDMLANRVSTTWTANSLRKGLLFFQLSISVALLLLTSLFYNQVTFLTDKSLGYEKENKIVIPLDRVGTIGIEDWRSVSKRHPTGQQCEFCHEGYPGNLVGSEGPNQDVQGSDARGTYQYALPWDVDSLRLLKIATIASRKIDFVENEFYNAVLLNESAFNALGLDEEDVGTEQEIAYEIGARRGRRIRFPPRVAPS